MTPAGQAGAAKTPEVSNRARRPFQTRLRLPGSLTGTRVPVTGFGILPSLWSCSFLAQVQHIGSPSKSVETIARFDSLPQRTQAIFGVLSRFGR